MKHDTDLLLNPYKLKKLSLGFLRPHEFDRNIYCGWRTKRLPVASTDTCVYDRLCHCHWKQRSKPDDWKTQPDDD